MNSRMLELPEVVVEWLEELEQEAKAEAIAKVQEHSTATPELANPSKMPLLEPEGSAWMLNADPDMGKQSGRAVEELDTWFSKENLPISDGLPELGWCDREGEPRAARRRAEVPVALPENSDVKVNKKLGYISGAEISEKCTLTLERETAPPPNYCHVTDRASCAAVIAPYKEASVLGIDMEVTGSDPYSDRIRLIAFSAPGLPVLVVDTLSAGIESIQELLQGGAVLVAHDWKLGYKFCLRAGITPTAPLFETQLSSQLLSASVREKENCELHEVVRCYLGIELDVCDRLSSSKEVCRWSGSATDPNVGHLRSLARRAAVLLPLRQVLRENLLEADLLGAARIEFNCLPAVAEMELHGMQLDVTRWKVLTKELEVRKGAAARKFKEHLSASSSQWTSKGREEAVDIDSSTQVQVALQSIGIPVENTRAKMLKPFVEKYPAIAALLEYRSCAKALSLFGTPLPKHNHPVTGRIHPSYKQIGTASGRFSCSAPNLQQVPRSIEVRQCFVPAPGYKLIVCDYSQMELRIAAEISKDRRMLEAYQKGEDLHCLTASLILNKPLAEVSKGDRQMAKSLNFGLLYGMGVSGLRSYARANYGVEMTEQEASYFRGKFFQSYPGLASWQRREKAAFYSGKKYETRTLAGRRCQHVDRLTVMLNLPLQGSGADILKVALALLHRPLVDMGGKIVGCIHDEILVEAPEEHADEVVREVCNCMQKAGEEYLRSLPVEVKAIAGESWACG